MPGVCFGEIQTAMKEKTERNEMIFGLRAVIEAIEAGNTLDKVFLKNDTTGDLARELLNLARERNIPVQRVPLEKLNRLTRKNHQGAVAFISPVPYLDVEDVVTNCFDSGEAPFVIVLDGITDTRNFGAIARTADCAGASAIVIPEKGSVSVTPEAIKTSAGALFHIPVCRCRNLLDTVRVLKASGLKIVAASEKAVINYTETGYSEPVAIVMGSEDVGISPQVLRECDDMVAIPMRGNISSLNVSVAAGIMFYEVVRQRLHVK